MLSQVLLLIYNIYMQSILFSGMRRYSRNRQTFVSREAYCRKRRVDYENDDHSASSADSPGSPTMTYEQFSLNLTGRAITSSPVRFLNEEQETCDNKISDDSADSENSFLCDTVCRGSYMSLESFSHRFLDIKIAHGISDVAARSILELITDALPVPNKCPKLNDLTTNVDAFYQKETDGENVYLIVDLEVQLRKLISEYSDFFSTPNYGLSDISGSDCYDNMDSDQVKFVYIILSTDGVSSVSQSKAYQLWPIMASVINLHPLRRRRFKNLLLCMLYYGNSAPNFDKFLSLFVKQIESVSFYIENFLVKIKVVTLCADLPAKAKCLNMVNFNGYFGCTNCLIHGTYHSEFRKVIYPITSEPSPKRNSTSHRQHVRHCHENRPCYGVKGHSPLLQVMSLPILPYDNMHLLFLGMTRSLVMHLFKRHPSIEQVVTPFFVSIKVPASFKRKPRCLKCIPKFKATEWKHMILYYFPVFFDNVSDFVKGLLLCLSVFIRILMKPYVSECDIRSSKLILTKFRRLSLELFGESIQTMTFHALEHLPDQIKIFGALWSVSASLFENAYRHLKKHVTGTRNPAQLIVKRFISQKMCSKNDFTSNEYCSLQTLGSSVSVDNSILALYNGFETDSSGLFFFRFVHNRVIFHSFSYSRKQNSASYFAVLKNEVFVRIDHIVVQREEIFCLCTELEKIANISSLIDLPGIEELINNKSPTFKVKYGRLCVFPANMFENHLVVVMLKDSIFATVVMDNFEVE